MGIDEMRSKPPPPAGLGMVIWGRWTEKQVTLHWTREPQRSRAWHRAVNQHWRQMRQALPFVYDAPLAALREAQAEGGQLSLTFSPSRYRYTAVTHQPDARRWLKEYGPQGLGQGVACALSLVCPQGLVLAQRSQRVMGGQGLWHPIAGHFDPLTHMDPKGRPSPFITVLHEVAEETGLRPRELKNLTLVGVQHHPRTQKPELHFWATTPLSFSEIHRRAQNAADAHEHAALGVFDPAARAVLLSHRRTATPVALACLWLTNKLEENSG